MVILEYGQSNDVTFIGGKFKGNNLFYFCPNIDHYLFSNNHMVNVVTQHLYDNKLGLKLTNTSIMSQPGFVIIYAHNSCIIV